MEEAVNFGLFETEGGKIAVTVFMLIWLSVLAAVMHVTHHDPQETGRALLSNAFTCLMTVLLAKLGGKQEPKA